MKTRLEHDLLGEKEVPADAYYGIQTLRGIENFANISGIDNWKLSSLCKSFGYGKMGCFPGEPRTGLIAGQYCHMLSQKACEEIIEGKLGDQFPVDLIQGGAGTSTNMNINEVVANRALELMGHQKGEYQYCHPE